MGRVPDGQSETSAPYPICTVIALENAGLVQLRLDFGGGSEMVALLFKDEAFSLSGELNSAALQIDQAEAP